SSSEKPESIGEKLSREAQLLWSLKDNLVPEITGKSDYYDFADPPEFGDDVNATFGRTVVAASGSTIGMALRVSKGFPLAVAGIAAALDLIGRAAPVLYDAWNHPHNEYEDELKLAHQVKEGLYDIGSLAGGMVFGYGMGKVVGFENLPPGELLSGSSAAKLP